MRLSLSSIAFFSVCTICSFTAAAQRGVEQKVLLSAVVATPVEAPKPKVKEAPVKKSETPMWSEEDRMPLPSTTTVKEMLKPGVAEPGSFTNYLLNRGLPQPVYRGPTEKQGGC